MEQIQERLLGVHVGLIHEAESRELNGGHSQDVEPVSVQTPPGTSLGKRSQRRPDPPPNSSQSGGPNFF